MERGQGDRCRATESSTKRRSAKTVLRLPNLDHSKSSVLQSLGSAALQRPIALLSIDSPVGNVRSLVWLSVGQSHYGNATRWDRANSPPPPSICVSPL
jgi:hypothetical protein